MARKMKMGQVLVWLGGTLFVVYLNTFVVWLWPESECVGPWRRGGVGCGFRNLRLPDDTKSGATGWRRVGGVEQQTVSCAG